MADAIQWTIEQFYNQLQLLLDRIHQVEGQLNQNKAELQAAYTATRSDSNPTRAAQNRALLDPLIHQNSVLRLSYLAPVKDKFNQGVQLASNVLRGAGYSTPNLSGLGFVIALAPATAVAVIVVALSAIAVCATLTDAQRARSKALLDSLSKAKTSQEVTATLAAMKAATDAERNANPPLGIDLQGLLPVLGLVALLVFAPTLKGLLPARKAA